VNYCYVEFQAEDSEALDRLRGLVDRLRSDLGRKQRLEKEWSRAFTESELQTFWWPNQQQLADVMQRWGDVPILVSQKIENRQTDWDVYSMFEIIAESEYTLEGLKPAGANLHHLAFNPMAYPYGGTQSLQRLVRAFGFTVVAVDDGTGRTEPVNALGQDSERNLAKARRPWWRFWQ
jgi:hypothetical protein